MKKAIVCVLIVLAMLVAAGCDSVKIGSMSSLYYNADEFEDAVNTLMGDFKSFEGCTLKEVNYAGDKTVKAEAEARGYAPERLIVLETTFMTDGTDHHNGFEPNHTYEKYQFIYTREFKDGMWILLDHGYC